MAQARPQNVNDNLKLLSNEKWEYIINNYIKSEIDRKIAKLYYLDGIPQVDIGAEVGYSRSTIKKRLPKILNIIEKHQNETKN
jgi:DNA-directed RNA polymerase specialized sigma subunit